MIFLYIIGAIMIIYMIFITWSQKYSCPYKLITIFGAPGTGKTMILTKIANEYLKKGKRVLCTDSTIEGIEYIKPEDIGSYWLPEESILLIDEASTVFNNRNWKALSQDKIKWFKYLRHNKIRIYAASQDYADLDVTLRRLTTTYYLMKKYFNVFIVARRITKGISLTEPVGEQAGSIVDSFEYAPLLAPESMMWCLVPKWCKKYNSFTKLPYPLWDERKNKKVSKCD